MSQAVKISDRLLTKALIHAKAMHRSTAGQIEYWANIGQIAEDNPDLPFNFIKDILISMEEVKANKLEDYKFEDNKDAT